MSREVLERNDQGKEIVVVYRRSQAERDAARVERQRERERAAQVANSLHRDRRNTPAR